MNNFIYEKLAVTNLKNNRKTYVPYIFTGVLTVMMFYIIDALSRGKGITQDTLKICLQYATGVIVVFAVIFLFYTNSFLIKRRKVGRVVLARGRLGCEFAHPLQVGGHHRHTAFCGLCQRDAIIGVAFCDGHATALRGHFLCNTQACCVILCTINAQTGGETLH